MPIKKTFFAVVAYLYFLASATFPSSDKINPNTSLDVHNLEKKIIIDVSGRKMYIYQNGKVKGYSVAVGKNKSTPIGEFKIINKVKNPDWWPSSDSTWLSDEVRECVSKYGYIPNESHLNPFGAYWIGISTKSVSGNRYGIHGTNDPHSIGEAVSHGCIRASKEALEEVIKFPVGTEVLIKE